MEQTERYLFRLINDEDGFIKARDLFIAYADSLDIDLHFQGFEDELKEINIQYNKPSGGLILITDQQSGEEIGCVGIRRFEDKVAELKRMFVKESHRKKGLGKELMQRAIRLSRDLGYKKILLDTLDSMEPAIAIYKKAGFRETHAYRYNPYDKVRYYEFQIRDND